MPEDPPLSVVDGCARVTRYLEKGQVIGDLSGEPRLRHPSRWTLQLTADVHVDVPPPFAFMEHACRPSARFQADGTVIALRDLEPGDAVTLFYPRTEWLMAEAFECRCGDRSCLGLISGGHALPLALLRELEAAEHVLVLALARDHDGRALALP